jgi:hypothetical protein
MNSFVFLTSGEQENFRTCGGLWNKIFNMNFVQAIHNEDGPHAGRPDDRED